MPLSFWIKRFLIVFIGAFVVLLVVDLLKERSLMLAVEEGALWAGITTTIFIVTRIYRSRRGQHCELCGDTPQEGEDKACPVKKEEPGP